VKKLQTHTYLTKTINQAILKKANYLSNKKITHQQKENLIIGAFLAYRYRNLMNPLAPQAMANRNGGSTGAEFNPHTI